MARIELLPEVFDDFERFLENLAHHEMLDASARIHEILPAIDTVFVLAIRSQREPGFKPR